MEDQALAFPALGPAKRGRGDPRIPPLKSALQKYIRRGLVTTAVAVAAEMARIPGGEQSVWRRLPVIAAEDVGYWFVPEIMAAELPTAPTDDLIRLYDVVAALAAAPKDKTPYWLANLVWADRHRPQEMTTDALRTAINVADYYEATAIAIYADDVGIMHGKGGLAVVMHETAETLPEPARAIVKACLARTARGGAGELFAAMMIAAIDQPRDEPPTLRVPPYQVLDRPVPLDPWTQDGHTKLGKIGLGISGRRLRWPALNLAELMFNFESIKMGPIEVPDQRWRTDALALDAAQGGWVTHALGQELWAKIGPDVLSSIRWIQEREQERGGFV